MINHLANTPACGTQRFVVANANQRLAARRLSIWLPVILLSWLLCSCGVLEQAPENVGDYPTDFARFLNETEAHAEYEDFVYFLHSHDVHNIVPVWQLLQQGSDWQKHQLPKYALPDREHWDSMINTLVFLKYDLIPYIGDVRVLSGFRTPHYNLAAGGAGKSRHLTFSALDLRPVADIERAQLHGILQNRWLNLGREYNLGLGLYAHLRFHIDTGGYRQW